MNFHLHDLRKSFAWLASGAFLLVPMVFAIDRYTKPDEGLAPVSGRIMIGGRPLHDSIICFDSEVGSHSGFCSVYPDGTYRLENTCVGDGVAPGRYKVHVYPLPKGPDLPRQFQQSHTSGVEVQVAPDWNELDLDLH